jgi:thiol-disulfide isomerase/thioredoxin
MKLKIFPVAAAIAICSALLVSGCMRPSTEAPALDVGNPAPAFKLPDLNGRQVSLDQYKGKVVLLDFWATWCNPCRISMPLLEQLQKEYPNNLVLLTVNLQDPRDDVREFMRQQHLNAQVLLDEQGDVGRVYGSTQIPMQVLIDKEGIVRDVRIGFNAGTVSQLRAEIERLR